MTSTLDATLATIAVPEGYRAWMGFVVKGGSAIYTIELSDRPDLPFTHKLSTGHGPVYGNWSEYSGRVVQVQRNGWRNCRGVLGTFDAVDAFKVTGWAVVAPN